MSRWHKPSCDKPDIVISAARFPRCLTCDSVPNLESLIAAEAKADEPWSPPPDNPVGKLNLRWPPCGAYRNSSSASATTSVGQPAQPSDLISAVGTTAAPSPSIYVDSLGLEDIRLLCLNPSETADAPLHGSLLSYPHEFCPEYDAASYAWGGEDGDMSRDQPIYIGPYWDVLLQTKNCRSLLRYLRPRMGLRTVWVDALCINQKDKAERVNQVSRMGYIYQGCSRAILYLGDGVVEASEQPYRARQKLHLISAEKLQRALKMRYFQRIWIIQELVLVSDSESFICF